MRARLSDASLLAFYHSFSSLRALVAQALFRAVKAVPVMTGFKKVSSIRVKPCTPTLDHRPDPGSPHCPLSFASVGIPQPNEVWCAETTDIPWPRTFVVGLLHGLCHAGRPLMAACHDLGGRLLRRGPEGSHGVALQIFNAEIHLEGLQRHPEGPG